jgi:hypothetical protein
VTVAVVNWNTRALTAACLDTLQASVKDEPVAVIVVDNGSTDGSAEMIAASYPHVTLVRNASNHGFAYAVNQAFRASGGDYLLLLNSDAQVPDGAIATCVRYMDQHIDVGALGCRLAYPDGRPQSSCYRFKSLRGVALNALFLAQAFRRSAWANWPRYGEREWSAPADVDCVVGAFMMIRRAAVPGDTLFDPGYFVYGEEEDFCYRLRQAGWRTVHLPEVTVVHHHSASSGSPRSAAWAYEVKRRAILRFLWKWRGPWIAWAANLIMLTDLAPRALAWGVQDALAAQGARRMLRLRVTAFHVVALLRPGAMTAPWHPPSQDGTA